MDFLWIFVVLAGGAKSPFPARDRCTVTLASASHLISFNRTAPHYRPTEVRTYVLRINFRYLRIDLHTVLLLQKKGGAGDGGGADCDVKAASISLPPFIDGRTTPSPGRG